MWEECSDSTTYIESRWNEDEENNEVSAAKQANPISNRIVPTPTSDGKLRAAASARYVLASLLSDTLRKNRKLG